jgi:hypothetical protein
VCLWLFEVGGEWAHVWIGGLRRRSIKLPAAGRMWDFSGSQHGALSPVCKHMLSFSHHSKLSSQLEKPLEPQHTTHDGTALAVAVL